MFVTGFDELATTAHPSLRFQDIKPASNRDTFLNVDNLYLTYNGRGALFHVLDALHVQPGKEVLVPAFHCPTVVDPVIAAGFTPKYYGIKRDLSIDVEDAIAKIDENIAALIVVNYFGFPTSFDALLSACRDCGTMILEDCAHSFLRTDPIEITGKRGDAAIYSFKKLVPSLVGGGASFNNEFTPTSIDLRNTPISTAVLDCKRLLEQAIDNLGDESLTRQCYQWFEHRRVQWKRRNHSETELRSEKDRIVQFDYPYEKRLAESRMPWYAKKILCCANLETIASLRRRNFGKLIELLSDATQPIRVFEHLPDRVCPWAFPVTIQNRSEIDIQLRDRGVPVFTFGETLHPSFIDHRMRNSELVLNARSLSETMLCIPIHQMVHTKSLEEWAEHISELCA